MRSTLILREFSSLDEQSVKVDLLGIVGLALKQIFKSLMKEMLGRSYSFSEVEGTVRTLYTLTFL